MFNDDPLRFTYLVIQDNDKLDEVSPFQGFGASWPSTLWALRFLALAPSSFLERGLSLDGLLSLWVGGASSIKWTPLWISALEDSRVDDFGFAVVVCSGNSDVADRVDTWCKEQSRLVLHVRSGQIGSDEQGREFVDTVFLEHCRKMLDEHGYLLSLQRYQAARSGLEKWFARTPVVDRATPQGHNTSLPNELVFLRAGRRRPAANPFIGRSEQEYDQLATSSALSVLEFREKVELRPANRLHTPKPGLLLTEPALFRGAYRGPSHKESKASGPALKALRFLQKQSGLYNEFDPAELAVLLQDEGAKAIISARQSELATHFSGVGLMAAQTCSAVLRMRPAVNRVFPTLRRYAQNVRAPSFSARVKTVRLFADIQRELLDAVGSERSKFISQYIGPIKIIADAPLELLPVGNLPLALRQECSRIPATPGNLMMRLHAAPDPILLDLATLCRVLIISAFEEGDPLRNFMRQAVNFNAEVYRSRVKVEFIRVSNRKELVAALNASDATILIFDGHGVAGDQDGIGRIDVAGERVDVWSLRAEARIPPIVVLSACDTHGLDATTHATVGNGFLAAGAMTVLATFLPIGGREGAIFIGRLLHRLAEYLPALLSQKHSVANWSGVITGLLRMVLGFDLVRGIIKDTSQHQALMIRANVHINTGNPNWYDLIIQDLVDATGSATSRLEQLSSKIVARSEALRYVQLGFPERITIDDGSIYADLVPPGLPEELGVG